MLARLKGEKKHNPNHETLVIHGDLFQISLELLHLALDYTAHALDLTQPVAVLLRRVEMKEQYGQTTQLAG